MHLSLQLLFEIKQMAFSSMTELGKEQREGNSQLQQSLSCHHEGAPQGTDIESMSRALPLPLTASMAQVCIPHRSSGFEAAPLCGCSFKDLLSTNKPGCPTQCTP